MNKRKMQKQFKEQNLKSLLLGLEKTKQTNTKNYNAKVFDNS